ncbi:RICIN domain-containing protein [Streptomyces litchfieldiae]|uniref:RICIN domain-containing protein n=1 Tax=Streptomyces litchfieldiae TaxID=3075543 RepID=A0ABU2MRF7_9ACTN|nr:RICIN domain-containing protein [Streptomyces sp. DSM 44938]MDT0344212.1 RICIN domain-containing protein [Streptomyces sp. DSM 44938]
MRRNLPLAAGAAAALITLTTGTAQAADAPLTMLIGDASLSLYASAAPADGTANDPYVRMLRLAGAPEQHWQFAANGESTTIVNVGTGGCLGIDPAGLLPYATLSHCTGDRTQLWDLKWDDIGTVFVNAGTGECLTQPPTFTPPGAGDRLTVTRCDGGESQSFSIVW